MRWHYFGISPAFESLGAFVVAGACELAFDAGGVTGAAGTVGFCKSITLAACGRFDEYQVKPKLVRKNSAAIIAVVRLRKFAEPEAPNKLPDAPLPNAAPMSAPFPCCSSTNPQMAAATKT